MSASRLLVWGSAAVIIIYASSRILFQTSRRRNFINKTIGYLSYHNPLATVRFATYQDLEKMAVLYRNKDIKALQAYIKPLLFVKRVHKGGVADYTGGESENLQFRYPEKGYVVERKFDESAESCAVGLHFTILDHLSSFYECGEDVVVAQILLDNTLKIRFDLNHCWGPKIRVAEANVLYYVKNVSCF